MNFSKLIVLPFLVLIVLSTLLLYKVFFISTSSNDTHIYIYQNDTYSNVYNQLSDKRLIKDKIVFNALVKGFGYKKNIKSGHYLIKKGTSQFKLISTLSRGIQTPVNVLIRSINIKQKLASILSKQLELDSLDFHYFFTDSIWLDSLNYNKENIMCLFIPNTYSMYWNVSLKGFVKRMLKENAIFWNTERKEEAKKINLSPNEVYILASIVQKEYLKKDERSKIAGVYLNRLSINKKLEADPTVVYATGAYAAKRILKKQLKFKSPYNTYLHVGLPPGPICIPEYSTIDATLNPEHHNYLYFCAKEDFSGYHIFSKTYSQHLANAEKYQRALNKRNIYE